MLQLTKQHFTREGPFDFVLEEASEFYVARRMDSSVKQALAGKQIDEVDV